LRNLNIYTYFFVCCFCCLLVLCWQKNLKFYCNCYKVDLLQGFFQLKKLISYKLFKIESSFKYELIKQISFIFWTGSLRFQYFFFLKHPNITYITFTNFGIYKDEDNNEIKNIVDAGILPANLESAILSNSML
jgi:hypothetical protein